MSSARGESLARSRRHSRSRARPRVGAEIQRWTVGASFGGFPMSNVVVLELGAAIAFVIIAVAPSLWPLAALVVLGALAVGCTRWRGRWLPQWTGLLVRFLCRSRGRVAAPVAARTELSRDATRDLTGPEDARVALLRLLVEDLVVASSTDHEQQPVGLSWHRGAWTAALAIDPVPVMVSPVGAHTDVPLAALAHCLRDRGVVLDSIGVIWHCYPGSSRLPADSPAVAAYNEVLGPLPAVAQRSTWVTVRLDPSRCPDAVHERGGGVAGAHRALLGALSRVQGALDAAGLNSRVLSTDELLRAAVSCAELAAEVGQSARVELNERWGGVRSGGVAHAGYSISNWPLETGRLDALTSIRALSTTVALALSTGTEHDNVGLRGLVRVSARTAEELATAEGRLTALTAGSGIRVFRLNGQHAQAVASTLPVGGAA